MCAQSIPGGSRSAMAKLLSVARSQGVHGLFSFAHSSQEPLPGAAPLPRLRPPIEGGREKGGFATKGATFFGGGAQVWERGGFCSSRKMHSSGAATRGCP